MAKLEFCNRTSGASTLTLALAYYNFPQSHVRSSRNAPDLTVVLNPRWSVRGWWEIPQNGCTTVIHRDLNQPNYYYYVRSEDDSYDLQGNYGLCGHKYNGFHVEYAIKDNNLVRILALKQPSAIDSAPVNEETSLQEACADLGYELLPFNQLPVEDRKDFSLTFVD